MATTIILPANPVPAAQRTIIVQQHRPTGRPPTSLSRKVFGANADGNGGKSPVNYSNEIPTTSSRSNLRAFGMRQTLRGIHIDRPHNRLRVLRYLGKGAPQPICRKYGGRREPGGQGFVPFKRIGVSQTLGQKARDDYWANRK